MKTTLNKIHKHYQGDYEDEYGWKRLIKNLGKTKIEQREEL